MAALGSAAGGQQDRWPLRHRHPRQRAERGLSCPSRLVGPAAPRRRGRPPEHLRWRGGRPEDPLGFAARVCADGLRARHGHGASCVSRHRAGGRRPHPALADIDALAQPTGARSLFGLSSGALIALQAALVLPPIRRVAVYEPPLSVNHSTPTGWVARYDREVTQGRLGSAAVTAIKGTQTAPLV